MRREEPVPMLPEERPDDFAVGFRDGQRLDLGAGKHDVRVRLGEGIYALRAVRVTDPALREPILEDRGYDPVPDGIVLFRFEPRT